MVVNFDELGRRIKAKRLSKGMTQEQLSEAIGLSSVYISHIECGSGKCSLETLIKICNALQTTPDSFLLDSLYVPTGYIMEEISEKLNSCSSDELRVISGIISVIIETK